jgi:hypothetical protein
MTSESDLVRENKSTPNAGGETDDQAGRANPNVTPASSAPQPPPAETHYHITCKTEKDWWDKAKPVVEIAGIVLLGVYTLYTIKMYRANKKAAEAAKSAADTASSALIESQKSFKLEQRPYLVPQPNGAPGFVQLPVAGSTARASLTFINVGHSPAQLAIAFARMTRLAVKPKTFPRGLAVIDRIFKEIEANAAKPDNPNFVLPRQDVAPGSTWFITKELDSPLLPDEVAELPSGEHFALLYLGLIKYTDPFGQKLETEFCWFWFGTDPNTWHYCPIHNVIR